MGKVAVVLFNLGGPDGPAAVRPFLFNLFRDKAIIALPAIARYPIAALISGLRAKSARANYAVMGGGSPLLPETKKQAAALAAELNRRDPDTETRVFISMRYWHPLSGETARAVKAFDPDEVVLLPLYPQYSTTTTASSFEAWHKACRHRTPVRAVCCYPDHDGVIGAHANRILAAYDAAGRPEPIRILFSAHGLPEKIVTAGDPYQAQIEATAAAILRRLPGQWDSTICYQSRVGPMKWLGPSTPQGIEAAASEGLGALVVPIAFVSEHIETLVELDHEYAELAKGLNCPSYVRVPALGVEPAFVEALADLAQDALKRTPGVSPGSNWRCGAEWGQCPANRGAAA